MKMKLPSVTRASPPGAKPMLHRPSDAKDSVMLENNASSFKKKRVPPSTAPAQPKTDGLGSDLTVYRKKLFPNLDVMPAIR